jgi:hypothetical protein
LVTGIKVVVMVEDDFVEVVGVMMPWIHDE